MSKRKNILHITSVSSIGGAEKLILELAKSGQEIFKDSTVYVVVIGPYGKLNQELIKYNIENINLKLKLKIGLPLAFIKLLFYVYGKKIKIIHSHLFLGGFFAANLKLFCPWISIIHTRHYADVYWSYRKNVVRRFIDKFFVNKIATKLVAISNDVKKVLLMEKSSEIKTIVIPNGVVRREKYFLSAEEENIKTFINNKIVSFKDKFKDSLVLYNVGAFRNGKGHINILRLMKRIVDSDLKVLCLFIGDGPHMFQVRDYCYKNDLQDHIIFLGFQEHPYAFIENCDIFLHLPDLEGFGLVVCEAMREEKIVMASNVGGIGEIIEDGYNGFLVSNKLVEDQFIMIKKIARLTMEEKSELLENAKRTFLKKYTLKKCSTKYNKLYNDILFYTRFLSNILK